MKFSPAKAFIRLSSGATHPYIGEPVSQLEHALQCADLARHAGASDTLICAALFHDIGHLCGTTAASMDGFGALHHEQIGADFLQDCGFPPAVTELVCGHVQAKRFLVTTNEKYRSQLSLASQATLQFQGGLMSLAEIESFRKDPLMKSKLQLRAWDEQAKFENRGTETVDYYQNFFRDFFACLDKHGPSSTTK